MQYFRRFLVAIACGLLPLTLFGFGLAYSLQQTIGKPDTVKHALDESGIYDTAVASFLNKSQEESATDPYGMQADEIPADQPEVKEAIQKAFPPELLSEQVGQAIDSTYAWVQGDTPELSFSLQFAEAKPKLANYLEEYTKNRAASLPVCPADTPLTADIDVFNATCRPALVSPEAIGAQARQEVMTDNFLKDSAVTADEITGQDPGVRKYLDQIPGAYDKLMLSVYINGILAVVLAAAAIFLHTSKRQGSKRVAVIVLTVGILSTIAAWLSSFIISKIVDSVGKGSTTEAIQIKLLDVLNILLADLRNWWMGFGILITVLAIGGLVALKITAPKVSAEQLQGSPKPKQPPQAAV